MKEQIIQLAHGGGGRLSRSLINDHILPRLGNSILNSLPDAASLEIAQEDIVFSTDSFVVQPIFFPGGNIGDLAVHGTVNDLSVAGGAPLYLSLALILEEGLGLATLDKILDSIAMAAEQANVRIVTGDTKVVANGQCDQMYINTAGIGVRIKDIIVSPSKIMPGDAIILSGTVGDHGMAVMTARRNIQIENGPKSDTAPVNRIVNALKDHATAAHFMRDPTRGGVATVLYEAAEDSALNIVLDEQRLPLSRATKVTSELLGLDPLNSPCEGRVLLICEGDQADAILSKIQSLPEGREAAVIGHVEQGDGMVILETLTGGRRIITPPSGELLPRIC